MATRLSSKTVQGPFGQQVRVQFFDDGSVRFRLLGASPMALTEAFLTGHEKNVLIRLEPREGSRYMSRVQGEEDERA